MALPNVGVPLSINDIQAEFPSLSPSAPHSLSEFYGAASGIPSAGTIAIDDFYGASNNLFAALIGPNDIGDWWMTNYGNQTISNGNFTGNTGTAVWPSGTATSGAISGFGKNLSVGVTPGGSSIEGAMDTPGYFFNTGIPCNSSSKITAIELRILGYTASNTSHGGSRNMFCVWPANSFRNYNALNYSYMYNTTDVGRGWIHSSSWSDKNNFTKGPITRTLLHAITLDYESQVGSAYYQNNGGSLVAARAGASTGSFSGSLGNFNITCTINNYNSQNPVISALMYVNKILTTTEIQSVGQWLYNDSTVNIHTGNR